MRNSIYLIIGGLALILCRRRFSADIAKHYDPLLKNANISKIPHQLFFICGVLVIASVVFMTRVNLNDMMLSAVALLSGPIYLIWSIPGYYRWKKNKKGFELALFVAKLSIGILIITGVIANAIYSF